MKDLFELFIIFARIGAVNFGGGYAMLPLLTHEFVDQKGWCTDQELTDYFAIGQCTPGLIAINVATFIGNKRKGLIGGIVATLGFCSCPIILLTIISAFLKNFASYTIVRDAFAGIRVCVVVLILIAIQRLWKKSIVDTVTLLLFLAVLALNILTDISLILLVLGAGVFGVVVRPLLLKSQAKKKGGSET